MRIKKVEVVMDMTDMINQIDKEKYVGFVNISFPADEACMLFERTQKAAGIIDDVTWDVNLQGNIPVLSRKEGILPENHNYVLYTAEMSDPETAMSYVKDGCKKLIQLLAKYDLNTFQTFAYVQENELCLMFNIVDDNGRRFGPKEEKKLIFAFMQESA